MIMEVVDLFAYLVRLRDLERVEMKYLPETLHKDLLTFVTGETLTRLTEDGKPVIPRKLYNNWIEKLNKKGFDYPIECDNITLPRIQN